jgi:integrase
VKSTIVLVRLLPPQLWNRLESDEWYLRSAVGHNVLAGTVAHLFKSAGIVGHYSNHSLHANSATRLFDSGLDEQLIMARTGHTSSAGDLQARD